MSKKQQRRKTVPVGDNNKSNELKAYIQALRKVEENLVENLSTLSEPQFISEICNDYPPLVAIGKFSKHPNK